jgi:hypothetical protein
MLSPTLEQRPPFTSSNNPTFTDRITRRQEESVRCITLLTVGIMVIHSLMSFSITNILFNSKVNTPLNKPDLVSLALALLEGATLGYCISKGRSCNVQNRQENPQIEATLELGSSNLSLHRDDLHIEHTLAGVPNSSLSSLDQGQGFQPSTPPTCIKKILFGLGAGFFTAAPLANLVLAQLALTGGHLDDCRSSLNLGLGSAISCVFFIPLGRFLIQNR